MLKSVNVIAMRNAALEMAAVLRPGDVRVIPLIEFAQAANRLADTLRWAEPKEEEKHG